MPSKSASQNNNRASLGLKLAAAGALLFLHIPVLIILLYAFTTDEATYSFPPPGLTAKWFGVAWARQDFWQAFGLSLRVAAIATLIALIMGTLAAAAVYRGRFFGRESISFLLILPLALPGIVTGIALRDERAALVTSADAVRDLCANVRPCDGILSGAGRYACLTSLEGYSRHCAEEYKP